jgi:hypothetical protein
MPPEADMKDDYEVFIQEMTIDPVKAMKARGFSLTDEQIKVLRTMPHDAQKLREIVSKKAYGALLSGGIFW